MFRHLVYGLEIDTLSFKFLVGLKCFPVFSFCKDVCMAFPETLGVYYSTTLPELAGSEAVDACSG